MLSIYILGFVGTLDSLMLWSRKRANRDEGEILLLWSLGWPIFIAVVVFKAIGKLIDKLIEFRNHI